MEYKFTKQKNKQDCGLAVSCMVINFLHNKNFLLEEIKFENAINDGEMTIYDIENLLEKYSIEFKSYMAEFSEFIHLELNFPLIVNVESEFKMSHYLVIYKKIKNKLLIADPNKNDLCWITLNEFQNIYTGYFGWAKKNKKHVFTKNSTLNSFKLMFDNLNLISLFFMLSIFANVSIIISSGFLKSYSSAIQINDQKNLNYVFLSYLIIFLLQIFLSFIINRVINLISRNLKAKLFNMYIEQLIKIDNDKFLSTSKEEWMNKSKHLNTIANYVCDIFLSIPTKFILFFVSIITVSFMALHLLFLLLIETCISFFVSYIFQYFIKERIFENENHVIEFTSNIRQLLEGHQEIKSKNLTHYIQKNIFQSFNKLNNNDIQVMMIKEHADVLLKILSRLFYVIIFYTSATLIFNKQLEFGQLLFYISISNYISNFTTSILTFILNRHEIYISFKQIKFIFKNNQEQFKQDFKQTIKSVRIKKLFVYQNDKVILNNLELNLQKNTFITGKSGVGKTTLLKLMSGLTCKYEGQIFINESDLKEINNKDYLKKIQYLGQYDFLFNGTVWQNIQMFQNDIDLDLFNQFKFLEILTNHNIALEKQIMDNGINLSKGQRQIINFIALFFTNKDTYFLDEPLSNVDWNTAHILMQMFISYKVNSLIILVDHNLGYQQYFQERIEL
ncbi:ATP-binding cassette domain-containing protein [Spiroplasma culicicola]|uniref:Bacteriocin ABC transporter n=1 Tax=Spiroplasma culicicola AES-1 TaxID=1276246 RepID=W6A7W3_9MOLU|nr:ATP-binding cassette domain-containing protein [Spiroplasma culicicola]AHI53081.1 bacteriocin ABC transporter [Spiroplasma culicicola AES-1]